MSRIPPKSKGKVFKIPFSKYRIFFYPDTMSIFIIDSIVEDIITLRETIGSRNQIIAKLLKKHTIEKIKHTLNELDKIGDKGAFEKMEPTGFMDFKKMLHKRISSIDIYLSHDCNMVCSYCFNRGGDFGIPFKKRMMDWKTAKKTIDWFFKYNTDSEDPLTICFCGGEPLLNLSVFKKSLIYINKKWVNSIKVPLRLILGTNGTLLNKDILKLMSLYSCQLIVSLDASKSEHDAKRVFKDGRRTYDIIMKNIEYIEGNFPRIKIIVNSTTTQASDFCSIFDRRRFNPTSKLKEQFNMEHGLYKDKKAQKRYLNTIKKVLKKYYISAFKNNKKFIFINEAAFSLLHNRKNTFFNRSNCGAGIVRAGISANGNIYICGLSFFDKKFKIGTVFSGICKKKTLWLIKEYNRIRKWRSKYCLNCWAKTSCRGECVLRAIGKNSKEFLTTQNYKSILCDITRLSLEYSIRNYVSMEAEDAMECYGAILENKKSNEKLTIDEKIRSSYLYRDLINNDFKHIKHLNPLFTKN